MTGSTVLPRRWTVAAMLLVALVATLLPTQPVAADTPPVAVAAGSPACPSTVATAGFYDVDASGPHGNTIDCLAWWGVTVGSAGHVYRPASPLLRGQNASFLDRTLQSTSLQLTAEARVSDVSGVHAQSVRRLVAAGIMPAPGGEFRPLDPLRRDDMAVALVAAHEKVTGKELPVSSTVRFSDLQRHPQRTIIEQAAVLGFTVGYSDGTFRPTATVTRAQMASFQSRLLDAMVTERKATTPTEAAWSGWAEFEQARRLAFAARATSVPSNLTPTLNDASDDLAAVYQNGCVAMAPSEAMSSCVYGDRTASRTLVLFGDSHAAHYLPAIDALGEERGWKVIVFARGGCTSLDITIITRGKVRTDCATWREEVIPVIDQIEPARVVLSGASHYAEYTSVAGMVEGQRKTVADIRSVAPEAHVTVLGPTPRLAFDAVDCLAANTTRVDRCTPTRKAVVDQTLLNGYSERAKLDKVRFVDTTPWHCTDQHCPLIIGGRLVYWDFHHMTATHGASLRGVFGEVGIVPR